MPDERERPLAARLFNRTWDLIEKVDRSADEDAEMLLTAAASRYHWAEAGTADHLGAGEWQVAHVASLLGLPDLAMFFTSRHLARAAAEGWDGWRLASAHEGAARACTAAGDGAGRARHLALARAALEREPEDDEREVIAGQLASIPDLPVPG